MVSQFRKNYITTLLLFTTLSLYLLLTTNEFVKSITQNHDKIAHVIVFTIEAFLLVKTLRYKYLRIEPTTRIIQQRFLAYNDLELVIKLNKYYVISIICFVVTIFSEFIQDYLTGGKRKFDTKDILANLVGSVIGISLGYFHEN
ncbi:hypothetical protein TBLA_0F02740 [Henningerozyma blattae CBS 6284]|uniref:VanZ-like domain-containing protein n=1 Tax=Henningerozyma blattae (strain ATCC 34711 / CBS 6284 / DSM 70876 / NBRC 10599 / NRRL Y-10934 / UCD 77-7) TaxID=1071380 RepID=I2H611_HENB6|nr:hypothetical protein TBLA_0F02740 [Tetrapisispora blattae CBS 6284]CCH61813.1 hypothetical protein TBLA_0F02740 [Tetrapisispora blattae CBS 6284]